MTADATTRRVIDGLPDKTDQQLDRLEQNCRRLAEGPDPAKVRQADIVLDAIAGERTGRQRDRAEAEDREAEAVRALPVRDRVLNAFRQIPPSDSEVRILKAVHQVGERGSAEIARAAGLNDAGAVNLVFGSLCSRREALLGTAPPSRARPGEKAYSALLVDFDRVPEQDGRIWHRWRLKPDAAEALRQLRLI